MKDMLIVIDMQNDFITGSLGTGEAKRIVPKVLNKIHEYNGNVVYTRDTHHEDYLSTQEGRNLPVKHCMEGTWGWSLEDSIRAEADSAGSRIFNKETFGSIGLAEYIKKLYEDGQVTSVEMVGLCTDICVISNALLLKAVVPELFITVDSECCAGVTPVSHETALAAMTKCQIKII